jgi:hypothetical protein
MMKFGLVVAALLSISMPAAATTLKLSPDIDLLVVDGKKMTGSLLKGADSLELDGGQHQLLFKVTKNVRARPAYAGLCFPAAGCLLQYAKDQPGGDRTAAHRERSRCATL